MVRLPVSPMPRFQRAIPALHPAVRPSRHRSLPLRELLYSSHGQSPSCRACPRRAPKCRRARIPLPSTHQPRGKLVAAPLESRRQRDAPLLCSGPGRPLVAVAVWQVVCRELCSVQVSPPNVEYLRPPCAPVATPFAARFQISCSRALPRARSSASPPPVLLAAAECKYPAPRNFPCHRRPTRFSPASPSRIPVPPRFLPASIPPVDLPSLSGRSFAAELRRPRPRACQSSVVPLGVARLPLPAPCDPFRTLAPRPAAAVFVVFAAPLAPLLPFSIRGSNIHNNCGLAEARSDPVPSPNQTSVPLSPFASSTAAGSSFAAGSPLRHPPAPRAFFQTTSPF